MPTAPPPALLRPPPTQNGPPILRFARRLADTALTGVNTQVDGKAGFGNTSGDGTSATGQITLPPIASPGVVLIAVSINSGSLTCGNPAYNAVDDGYTAAASNPNISGSTLEGWLFYKDVTVADSGKTLTCAFPSARRWTMGGVYLPGCTTASDLVVTATSSAATLTHIIIPGGTPTAADSCWVGLAAQRNNTTTPSSVDNSSAPAGWLEDVDVSSYVPSAPQYLIFAAHSQLVGNAGVLQADVNSSTAFTTATGTQVSWGVFVAPITSGATGTAAVTEGADTSAVVAVEEFTGTVAVTTADDTVTASGTFGDTVTGTVAVTTGDDTSAAAALETMTGTVAVTTANDTSAVSALETITGTVAVTTANDTSAVAALETFTGTVAVTTANDTSAVVALETFTGTLAKTTGDDTATASGSVDAGTPVTGTASVTTANDTSTSTGVVTSYWFATPTVRRRAGERRLYDIYTINRGVSVVKVAGHYRRYPIPSEDLLIGLVEGVDYFLGGRAATVVSSAVAAQLTADGFTVYDHDPTGE